MGLKNSGTEVYIMYQENLINNKDNEILHFLGTTDPVLELQNAQDNLLRSFSASFSASLCVVDTAI